MNESIQFSFSIFFFVKSFKLFHGCFHGGFHSKM
jgi:hypothetical protein